jgi:hypothetical protein
MRQQLALAGSTRTINTANISSGQTARVWLDDYFHLYLVPDVLRVNIMLIGFKPMVK